jgi:hypothetical protein
MKMTADERIALIRVKIERAKQHIHELNSEIRAFFDTNPFIVGTKRNPKTRQLIYYLVSVHEVPLTIAAIAGDILQNLRSALDHLAYQLVLVGRGSGDPLRHVYFPIADDAKKYESEKIKKTRGMREAAIKAIDAVKPYRGGNDILWHLNRLNNVDKHRLLITVGSAYRSINVGPHSDHFMQKIFGIKITGPPVFLRPADRQFPLKAGNELFIDYPDSEVNEQIQFQFEIAFGEAEVIKGKSLIETLQQMADSVDSLILSFAPFLV